MRPAEVIARIELGLMHVTEANAPGAEDTLPAILAGLRRRGLEPVTLSELLAG